MQGVGVYASLVYAVLRHIMCYRPANRPTSIHPSLQIGIPAFIADREDVFQLYFVTVTPIPQILTAPGKMQVCAASRCITLLQPQCCYRKTTRYVPCPSC